MSAVREQIFAAIEDRLRGIASPVVAEVERLPSADPVSFPALHIFDGGHRIVDMEAGTTRYTLTVPIEGYVEQSSGVAAHAALNALYAAVVAAVMPDPPLDGLAETIDEQDFRTAIAPLASIDRLGFAVDFEITFATRRGDPAQAA
jgi:hypothetical protein